MTRLLERWCFWLAMMAIMSASAMAGTVEGRVHVRDPKIILSDVIVSVEDINAPLSAPNPAVMDQRGLRFIPHVLAIVVGTTVAFPNSDPLAHNVFSISPAKRFNLGLYGPGTVRSLRFDEPGIVELLCNVHQEMSAYIVVLKSPYFARPRPDGFFRIPDVPPGRHRVRWWHERLGEVTRELEVTPKGVAMANVNLY